MKPCAQHLAAAQAALAAGGLDQRGDDAVASLWAAHGQAQMLLGADLSADFCPLCIVESRTPGSAATWVQNAVAVDVAKAAADAANAALQAAKVTLAGKS